MISSMLSSRLSPKISGRILWETYGPRLIQTQEVVKHRSFRWKSTSTRPQAISGPGSKKALLPERLLVFHAGTGRSVFLGCLKITTIFIFGFFSLVLAPAHFQSDEQPKWVAVGVALSGFVPVIAVAYITSPFVANVNLRLPMFARYSREMVMRYSETLPKDALLEITSVNFIGLPRVTILKAADLYPTKERLGLVNYSRDTTVLNKRRPWWTGKAPRQFGIHGGVRIPHGSGLWENIAKTIEKRPSSIYRL